MEEEKKLKYNNKNLVTDKKSDDGKSSLAEKGSSGGKDVKLIAVVRISGMVKVKSDIAETLDRLRLRRKYACVLVDSSDSGKMGMLKKVKYFVAYGLITEGVLKDLVKERGMMVDKSEKVNVDKVVEGLVSGKGLSELGLKPFFRLHPPRKGIRSKLQFPKGVLGDNGSKINELIGRML